VAGGGALALGDGGPATSVQLSPVGVSLDNAGNLYIADVRSHRIRRVDLNSGIISTAAGLTRGFSGDGFPAIRAQLYYPTGVFVDESGNLYIADDGNNRIRKVPIRKVPNVSVSPAGSSIGTTRNGVQ
jgi:DNA-binding beta-propeller fold protein YncE